MRAYIHLWSYLAQFFLEYIIFQTRVSRKSKYILYIKFFFFENYADHEIMWKNIVEQGRPHMTIGRMHIACWMHKARNTHSKYLLIIAFPLQQLLHECASTLRYITLPVLFSSGSFYLLRSAHRSNYYDP